MADETRVLPPPTAPPAPTPGSTTAAPTPAPTPAPGIAAPAAPATPPPPATLTDPARVTAVQVVLLLLTLSAGSLAAIGLDSLSQFFAGVMTGNGLMLGMAVANTDQGVAVRTAAVLVAYVAGAATAGWIVSGRRARHAFARGVPVVLWIEVLLLAGFEVVWTATAATPAGEERWYLLVGLAVVLGLQGGAVVRLGIEGASTTYMTGTLTTVAAALLARDRRTDRWSVLRLLAAATGALAGTALVHLLPSAAPVLPLLLVAAAAVVPLTRRRVRGRAVPHCW